MVERHGQSRKLASKTSAIDASVRIPADAARAVKELVAAHPEMSKSPLGKRVLFARKKTQTAGARLSDATVAPGGSVATGNDYCCGFGPGG